jgi:predicted dinucleotide-binding enzyme
MNIGIIGGDDRAVAIGRMLHSCGHQISFSDPTYVDAALHATQALDGRAEVRTPHEQAATCAAVVFTVHWDDLEAALRALGEYTDGVVIDATRPPDLHGTSGAELLARRLRNGHVVKAFVDDLDPACPVRVATDDAKARADVSFLISASGGTIEDLGPLSRALEIERTYAASVPMNV